LGAKRFVHSTHVWGLEHDYCHLLSSEEMP